jgi:hypothetical protein
MFHDVERLKICSMDLQTKSVLNKHGTFGTMLGAFAFSSQWGIGGLKQQPEEGG